MTETTYDENADQTGQTSLLHSFAIASVLVVAGVAGSAMLLSKPEIGSELSLPTVPVPTWLDPESSTVASDSWLDLADRAFTSGRMIEPVQDNALYYFHQAVESNSQDERAREGLGKVVAYVIGEAENAIYRSDWSEARQSAEAVIELLGSNAEASSVLDRVAKFEQVDVYAQIAVNQIATDRLLSPLGDNALHSYEQILLLDPGNTEAENGVRMIAQRLLAKSQSAVVVGDYAASARYIDQARKVAPNLAGLNEAAQVTGEFAKISRQRAIGGGALPNPVAEQAPKASAPQTLPDKKTTVDPVQQATQVPAIPVETVLNVSDLQVLRNASPVFPRRAQSVQKEGWVELNFRVDEVGHVIDPEVVRSSDTVFEHSALNAIRKWRFAPHIQSGVAVTVRSGVRFSFKR